MKYNKRQMASVVLAVIGAVMMVSAPMLWWMAATRVADSRHELKDNLVATGGLVGITGLAFVAFGVWVVTMWRTHDQTIADIVAERERDDYRYNRGHR